MIETLMSTKTLGLGIRSEFPIFSQSQRQLCFLDSAASSQKPKEVADRVATYLTHEHANIHRGAYLLSSHATELYENARLRVANFIGADSERSIIFTKNATEAINLVAHSYGELLNEGDTVLLTLLEHHSNIVPWQLLAKRKKINLQFVEINQDATINLEDLKSKIAKFKPKLLAITAQSNAFGTLIPLDIVMNIAKEQGTKVLVDASQKIVHSKINLKKLDPDFLVFTGHKLYGPTGVGVLYGRVSLLETMGPFLGGGDMIEKVTVEETTWAEVPRRFEAGTPPIAEIIGLATAIDFVEEIGFEAIEAHEKKVFTSAIELLRKEDGVTVYGPDNSGSDNSLAAQSSIISFNIGGVHPHDLSTIADSFNVQIRSGHHCAMPAMKALGIHGTARASIAIYSDISDFEMLVQAIKKAKKLLT